MEMLKIDQLPVEMLMKIFSYLPKYSDVSLVNKLFYSVARSVNDSNVWVSFFSIWKENGNHRSVMNGIVNSQRKISKLSIKVGLNFPHSIPDAVKIVKKFSETIKCFDLQNCSLEMCDFLQILSSLPNAELLKFSYILKKKPTQPHQFGNECLKLHRLKTLSLELLSDEFLDVFNRLPADVLKELTITYSELNLNLLAGLFEQQTKITELALLDVTNGCENKSTLPDHILDHLKLESLEFYQYSDYNSRYSSILSKQTELTSLRLREGKADGTVLNVITNQLMKLKELEIKVDSALVVPFKKIMNLKKLKSLKLQSCSLKLMETFAELDNSRITTLNITDITTRNMDAIDDDDDDDDPPMPINVFAALANSLPNLKVLDFGHYCECETIGAIMQNFNFIDVLKMNFRFNNDANRLTQVIVVDLCCNPKLTELIVTANFIFDESVLTKLVATYPNLKKLKLIGSPTSITTTQLKIILNGFKHMEWLELYVQKLTKEHIDCIIDHKNNLKSVTFKGFGFEIELSVEQKQKLSSIFDVIQLRCSTLHMGYGIQDDLKQKSLIKNIAIDLHFFLF